jgi:hypothetical protein
VQFCSSFACINEEIQKGKNDTVTENKGEDKKQSRGVLTHQTTDFVKTVATVPIGMHKIYSSFIRVVKNLKLEKN